MKFDELDSKMRVFETSLDTSVLPGVHIVARLDGRSFTKLTRETCDFKAPYDSVFRDHMIETAKHLMNSGFNIIYAYTQSDEISLLFHPSESAFGRKIQKLNSVLAGEASGCFSLQVGVIASFDCRISQLPTNSDVINYFRWRNEDAHRNALNSHCYWLLRRQGTSASEATASLHGLSVAAKNELLFQAGINFNDIPSWEKRGIGLIWETYKKRAVNKLTNEVTQAVRRRIVVDLELPLRDSYSTYISNILDECKQC